MTTALTDRVVLVTGASGNLGAAVARGFQGAGAQLVLADRAADRLAGLFPDLVAAPQHMLCSAVDVADPISVQHWVDAAVTRFGRIDVLANTVGGSTPSAATRPARRPTRRRWKPGTSC